MWREYNPNPDHAKRVGDCTVRAITKALNIDWDTAFLMITLKAFEHKDMPSSDYIWGEVLRENGFYRSAIPNTCPECYTAEEFCRDHPEGVFVLGFGGHVATVKDGDLYDSWDSSDAVPQFFWYRKER